VDGVRDQKELIFPLVPPQFLAAFVRPAFLKEGGRKGGRDGGREGGMEGWREGGREGGREIQS
jgi:hypothetical protein